MRAIHQFVAGFANGDAISNEAVALQTCFRSWGYASELFSEPRRVLPEYRNTVLAAADGHTLCNPEDLAILHLSVGSPVNDAFAALPCRKALIYHNITPSHYFDLVNRDTARSLAAGRHQLAALSNCAELNFADSSYNAEELRAAGYRNVTVLPLIIDFNRLAIPPDPHMCRTFDNGLINILFVGRCVPNKRLEDLLDLFDLFRQRVNRAARLIHVGSHAGSERYYYLLTALARTRRIEHVYFAGAVPQPQLNAFYRCADLFVGMSEHEGFCIPIMESFYHQVPVMAFAAGAVPETMGGAGVLFHDKALPALAEMMDELTRDTALRNAVIQGQRSRLEHYRRQNPEQILRHCLAPFMNT